MKKKISYIILTIAMMFTLNIGVSAETISCHYMYNPTNNVYQYYILDFQQDTSAEYELVKVQFLVTGIPLSQGTDIKEQKVLNYKTDFTTKTETDCPSYIVVDSRYGTIKASTSGTYALITTTSSPINEDSTALKYVSCGHGDTKSTGIPSFIPYLTSTAFNLLKMGTPIVLIIMGMLEIVKAVTKGTPEDFNKAKGKLFKKFIAAAIVFFIFSITQFVITNVASSEEAGTISECFNCYLNNECDPYVEEI